MTKRNSRKPCIIKSLPLKAQDVKKMDADLISHLATKMDIDDQVPFKS